MNTGKIYYDSNGNECSLDQLVRKEPGWAVSRIQEGEKAIERLWGMDWVKLSDRLPEFDESLRVLIYTEGVDFAGQQYFDVKAIDLCIDHPDREVPEEIAAATHWSIPVPPWDPPPPKNKAHHCTVCGRNPVTPELGEDTCQECLNKI